MIIKNSTELIIPSLNSLKKHFKPWEKITVIIDKKVSEIYGNEIKEALTPNFVLWIDDFEGEEIKQLEHIATITEQMLLHSMQKQDIVLAIGGGAITDFAGFLASVFKRGCISYYMPTTLLALVDASIGGKTALNVGHIKNSIGSFYLPEKVFIYPHFLDSISDSELKSGWAEIIKHQYLQGNYDFNAALNKPSSELILQNIQFKNSIITADYEEKSLRKILNFGHTIGHALEALFLHKHQPIPHGFAIAAGMIIETEISFLSNYLSEKNKNSIHQYLTKHYEFLHFLESDYDEIIWHLKNDKKNINNQISFTLLSDAKQALVNIHIEDEIIIQSLKSYQRNYLNIPSI